MLRIISNLFRVMIRTIQSIPGMGDGDMVLGLRTIGRTFPILSFLPWP